MIYRYAKCTEDKNWTRDVALFTMKMERGLIFMKCGCGKIHDVIPTEAEPAMKADWIIGWYWNCKCGTYLIVSDNQKAVV